MWSIGNLLSKDLLRVNTGGSSKIYRNVCYARYERTRYEKFPGEYTVQISFRPLQEGTI